MAKIINANPLQILRQSAGLFATIEKLIKLAKKEIAEVGIAEFKSAIISSKDECIESIKKEPLGSDFNASICFKWWRLGDSNS